MGVQLVPKLIVREGVVRFLDDPALAAPPTKLTWKPSANSGKIGTFNEQTYIEFDFSQQVYDPTMSAESYTVTDGVLPLGISLNTVNGMLSGTLPDVDVDTQYGFTVTIQDKAGGKVSGYWTINVLAVQAQVVWITPEGEVADVPAGSSVFVVFEARSL